MSTINGKTRYSAGTGLIMNRQQGSPFINTSYCNIWVKASTSLALGGKFIVNGSRVMSGGGIFLGNSTTPTNNFVTFELNGGAVLQNISTTQQMQMVRAFCETSGININQGTIDGRTLGGIPFSNAGWGTLNLSLAYGNFQCDGNGAVNPVTVANATLASNVNSFDYAYVANSNDKTKINKYIFKNSDVGSTLRTLGQTGTTWRLGVVEITKDVIFNVQDTSNAAIQNAVVYLKLNGATINPSAGSRYAGVDDYMTPRVYIAATNSSGVTPSQNILYAVAQGYATDATGAGTALTMDSLTTRSSDVTDGYIWSYGHLVGQPTAAMRGTGTLTQSWTEFADPSVTLSRTAAIAKLASSFTVNTSTKVVTVTANSTYDDLYDALKAYKCSTTQSQIEAPTIDSLIATPSGANLTGYTGWTLAVNTGVTLSEGTKFTYVYFPTITLNGTGKITGVYGTTSGVSTVLQFIDVPNNGAACVWDYTTGTTELYQLNTSGGNATYTIYYPPGSAGAQKNVARELYGYQREGETITLAAGKMWVTYSNVQDVGITQATQATVAAYTTLETSEKQYDYIAYLRLSSAWIKLGQIATRSGTAVDWGSYSGVIKSTASALVSLSGSVLTFKANGLAGTTKYDKYISTPPATWTADTTEVITINLEDGNGDSSVTISASAISTFEIWKITNATPEDNYATGTLLATVGVGKYRFLHVDGYKLVIRDTATNYRQSCSMSKGTYSVAMYFGDAVQLAQAPDVTTIKNNLAVMQIDVDKIISNQVVINGGVHKSSLLIPHNGSVQS